MSNYELKITKDGELLRSFSFPEYLIQLTATEEVIRIPHVMPIDDRIAQLEQRIRDLESRTTPTK